MSAPWFSWWIHVGSDVVTAVEKHMVFESPHDDEACAQMVSAAPNMCRALLAVEKERHSDGFWYCAFCRMAAAAHKPDCLLDAALTKAGLDTQEKRDMARKEMGL